MDSLILKRIIKEANYMIKTKNTIREISKVFNVWKSTVHKDLHERLLHINKDLYYEIEEILLYHKQVRHIRGGMSTKKKYKKLNLLIENN